MCAYDAAAVAEGANDEETCEDGLFAAESWDDQGPEEGEEGTDGGDKWGDHHENTAHAVSSFFTLYYIPGLMHIRYLIWKAWNERVHSATDADHGENAGRAGTQSA